MSDTTIATILGGCIGLASSFLMLSFNAWIKHRGSIKFFSKIDNPKGVYFVRDDGAKCAKVYLNFLLRIVNYKGAKKFLYINIILRFKGKLIYRLISREEDSFVMEPESIAKYNMGFYLSIEQSLASEIDEVVVIIKDEFDEEIQYQLLSLPDSWDTKLNYSSEWSELKKV